MATLTVRNIPDEAKHRFRQVAAAHGRSMEEHLRQLVIEADFDGALPVTGVSDVRQGFRHESTPSLNRMGGGPQEQSASQIREMSSAEFFSYLKELANGVTLELPPRANLSAEREIFGAD